MSMGILQAKILEWLAISFSRASSQAKDQTQVSHIAGIFFNDWATREDLTKDERKEGKQEKVIYIIEIQLIVYVSSSMGSSQHKDQTQVSHIAGGFFTRWATREALEYYTDV